MTSFIKDVLIDLKSKKVDFSKLVFILPSKRAGVVLKNELTKLQKSTFFAPEILSIEKFIEDLSSLKTHSNIELLFVFYKVYQENTEKEMLEPFDSFSKWAQVIIQDFNEIDRYLVNPKNIFEYINEIQKIEKAHWSLNSNQTEFTKRYLKFWSQIYKLYVELSDTLITSGFGYQGLIYKEAVENIENYIQKNEGRQHVFLGFNALNNSESIIMQELLQNELAFAYWDIDAAFIDSKIHNAAHFINSHKYNWKYFKNNRFNWVLSNYTSKKNIKVIGVPQNIGQAKVIGDLLSERKNIDNLKNTAVVLADETLLIPVINSLPKSLDAVNITMGFPLKETPFTSLFEQLISIHIQEKSYYYFKDVVSILSHQYIRPLFNAYDANITDNIVNHIHKNNLVFLSESKLLDITKGHKNVISLLFGNWKNDPKIAIHNILSLIILIKKSVSSKNKNALTLEYLYRYNEVFNIIINLSNKYSSVSSLKVLHGLFKEIVATETLDFQGEPLNGLQIMGMLESRVLDFETIIISSVNEGILPSGKSNNSFIPFDVKIENGLPTYSEKDAIYTYHFYRLIQRAKNVYLIYNTEIEALNGGEKSRFITQLEIEGVHNIEHQLISSKVPKIDVSLNTISKSEVVISKLKSIAEKGFSPSSLTTFIRNPIDFYHEKVLGVKETDGVEEIVAANTLGTIIHNTLEEFYKPFEGAFLDVEIIRSMILKINNTVKTHFLDVYKQGDITKGKNLIVFEIAKRYVSNYLNQEIETLRDGNTIKIISIESDLSIPIEIAELNFPVKLKGKVDRVDEYNGVTRIIDYKTGKVEQNKVQLENWEDITSDYDKYSKSFQVLSYALMLNTEKGLSNKTEAGIISFKNLKSGFIKFQKINREDCKIVKDSYINQDTLSEFSKQLKHLILEIFNPEIKFVEKKV